ncbi:MAG: formyltransferase family protein [Chloroflexia bacterium]
MRITRDHEDHTGAAPPRIVYFGGRSAFSLGPLRALINADLAPVAMILPAVGVPGSAPVRLRRSALGRGGLGLTRKSEAMGIVDAAIVADVDVYDVGTLDHPGTLASLAGFEADLYCAACFPRLLPPEVLRLPRLGCLNVHPSLLPAYRGPAPLFWSLRAGEAQLGTTVHLMDAGLDTGPVIEQEGFATPEGMGGAELDRMCSELGGELLVRAVRSLCLNIAELQVQGSAGASYEGWPCADDFVIPTTWSAKRAFNFVRAVDEWTTSPAIEIGAERILVRAALSYNPDELLPTAVVEVGVEVLVQFQPGVLRVGRM